MARQQKTPLPKLSAAYFTLRGQACNLVAEYEEANAIVPLRLLRFAGLGRKQKANKGPRPVVGPAIMRWFLQRDNQPATYREIADALSLKLNQVRTCCSRNEIESYERAGDEKVGDKLYAKVRLTTAGLAQAKTQSETT
jgi:hypothetical protein